MEVDYNTPSSIDAGSKNEFDIYTGITATSTRPAEGE